MLVRLLRRSALKRAGRFVPLAQLALAAELALLAGRHIGRLNRAQRHRLVALVRRAHGRPSSLAVAERRELEELVSMLEPRVFVGSAVRRVSPVPVPKRLLYGAKGSAARESAKAGRS
jgi:hypothetical protein